MPDIGKAFAREVIAQADAYVHGEARVLAIARRYVADVHLATVLDDFSAVVLKATPEEMGETEEDIDAWIAAWMRRKVEREPWIAIDMNP